MKPKPSKSIAIDVLFKQGRPFHLECPEHVTEELFSLLWALECDINTTLFTVVIANELADPLDYGWTAFKKWRVTRDTR